MERVYLTKENQVKQYENNLVSVTFPDGHTEDGLEPRRLFPVNLLDKYITFLDKDGVERCVVRQLSDLTPEGRQVVERSLNDYYLVPRITRIINVTERYGTLRWTVETERGERSFDIRNRNHDIRVNRDGSIRVRDSDDNRYIIVDYHALDKRSQSLLIADL